jgi:hypothetical protein
VAGADEQGGADEEGGADGGDAAFARVNLIWV